MRRLLFTILLLTLGVSFNAQELRLPNKQGTVKFAIIGDTGTGGSDQLNVATQLARYRSKYPFEFAIMLGDNLYGGERPADYVRKFEKPYKPLLDAGVKFYAALGNHDDTNQRLYKPFNMNGERYYTFKPGLTSGVRFFALDSNYMNPEQVDWLNKELAGSGSDWKIAFFHHPLYSSGDKHGAHVILRDQLEPPFIKHGVNVVFTGHEHFYERLKPQKGIAYFIAGSSAKLRTGDNTSELTAKTFDEGYTFMLAEIDGDDLHFQTITDKGVTVDSGIIRKDQTSNRVIGATGAAPARPSAPARPAPARPARPTQR
jgi:predicted phosphodiesterase